MTIKFFIRHHYKDVPIEITVEAPDTAYLRAEIEDAIEWIVQNRKLIDKLYEQTRKLTEKEKEKP